MTDSSYARRLMSYSAAAALGAFAMPHAAEGEIIYTNLEPDLEALNNQPPLINLDNAGYHEAAIINTLGNIQVRDAYSGNVLTASGSYYVKGFDFGDLIGPGSTETSDSGAHLAATGAYNFFDGDQKYIGVKFDIGGTTHYGWIGFQVDSQSPMHGIVRDYAYETEADTAIAAGVVPEPATLGLLAAGAGAFAVRRRRSA